MEGSASITRPALEWRTEVGPTGYPAALAAMEARAAAIRSGAASELVWLLEHPALYSRGTSARPEHLLAPARFPVFAAGRGGQWTYHGPGQRTVYTLLDLDQPHGLVRPRDLRSFVWGLEEWLIRSLARLGVSGERRAGRVGIWVANPSGAGENKIAAIGVRVTRWVTWHGMALNVEPDLAHFKGIVPCGLFEHGVTSLRACGSSATMADVDAALRAEWHDVFERTARGQRHT